MSKPVPTLVIYKIKPGTEEQFKPLLDTHWPTVHAIGLTTDDPPQIWRARYRDGRSAFVEIFSWKDETSSGVAHQTPEVMQIWEPMGPLLDDLEIIQLEAV
jgi:hypothetical protein